MQKGSPSRDTFKSLHKLKLPSAFYCSDLDLVLITKYPPSIIAFVDFKKVPGDSVSFSEGILYNSLVRIAPVFIIESPDAAKGPFRVRRYVVCDWKPTPPVTTFTDADVLCADWIELGRWESTIRRIT